jgi:hypothetical protein
MTTRIARNIFFQMICFAARNSVCFYLFVIVMGCGSKITAVNSSLLCTSYVIHSTSPVYLT